MPPRVSCCSERGNRSTQPQEKPSKPEAKLPHAWTPSREVGGAHVDVWIVSEHACDIVGRGRLQQRNRSPLPEPHDLLCNEGVHCREIGGLQKGSYHGLVHHLTTKPWGVINPYTPAA